MKKNKEIKKIINYLINNKVKKLMNNKIKFFNNKMKSINIH